MVIQPLSTRLIKPNFCFTLPPTQHHSFFRNLKHIGKIKFFQYFHSFSSIINIKKRIITKSCLGQIMKIFLNVCIICKTILQVQNYQEQQIWFEKLLAAIKEILRSQQNVVYIFIITILFGICFERIISLCIRPLLSCDSH